MTEMSSQSKSMTKDKDMTGIKVRDRFDVQPVDKGAVIKGQITEVING